MRKFNRLLDFLQISFLLVALFVVPKKKSKVVQIVNSLENGGLEQVVIDLHNELLRQSYESRICIWSDNVADIGHQIEDWTKVTILVENRKLYLRYLLKERPSSLHFHHSTLGVKYLTYCRFNLIYTMHNVYTWLDHSSAKEFYRLIANMDIVANVSNSVRDYYIFRAGLVGAKTSKTTVIENGIDFSLVPLRGEIKSKFEKIHLLVVSNYYPTKSLFAIFGLLEAAAKNSLDIQVSIAGYPSNELYHKDFMSHLATFKYKDRVNVLGSIDHSTLLGMLGDKEYDAFLSLSLQEGCSLALLEAVGSGLPVITTNTGNAAELSERWAAIFVAENPYNSIVSIDPSQISNLGHDSRPKNIGSLIQQIEYYAREKESSHQAAFDQVNSFRDQFGLPSLAKKYISLYSKQ